MDDAEFEHSVWRQVLRSWACKTTSSNVAVVSSGLSRGKGSCGDAKDSTIVHLGEGVAVQLDFAVEPLGGDVERDVVQVEVVELGKFDVRNVEQAFVVGGLGDEVSTLTVDENDDVRHDQQCSVGDAGDSRS